MENEPQDTQPQTTPPPKKKRRKVKRRPAAAAPVPKPSPKAKDALDALAEGDPRKVIMLMLWRDRFRNPDLSLQITEQDLKAFDDCVVYLGVEPQASIYRPHGRPAQEAIPASPGKRGIAARAAEPPRPFVFVGVVDKGGNQIKPIENNEEDADRRDQANQIRRFRDKAPMLSSLLLGMCQSGTFSTSEITEAAQALQVLARAA